MVGVKRSQAGRLLLGLLHSCVVGRRDGEGKIDGRGRGELGERETDGAERSTVDAGSAVSFGG